MGDGVQDSAKLCLQMLAQEIERCARGFSGCGLAGPRASGSESEFELMVDG